MKAHFLPTILMMILCVGLTIVACDSDDDDDSRGGNLSDDDDDNDDAGDDDDDDDVGDLTWQDPPSNERFTWEKAIAHCENLSFDGHDDWRLPTISELRSLISGCADTELGGPCDVTDGCTKGGCWNNPCSGCAYREGPGTDGAYWPAGMSGPIEWYWSSSPVADKEGEWGINFERGHLDNTPCTSVRCVRP